jgi:hypothetical protein
MEMSYNTGQLGALMDESPDVLHLQWDEWNLDHVQKHELN